MTTSNAFNPRLGSGVYDKAARRDVQLVRRNASFPTAFDSSAATNALPFAVQVPRQVLCPCRGSAVRNLT